MNDHAGWTKDGRCVRCGATDSSTACARRVTESQRIREIARKYARCAIDMACVADTLNAAKEWGLALDAAAKASAQLAFENGVREGKKLSRQRRARAS